MPLLEDAAAELARVREESTVNDERRAQEALEAFERMARTVIDETLGVQVAEIVFTEFDAANCPRAAMADLGEGEPDLALVPNDHGFVCLWLVKPCPACDHPVRFTPQVTSLYTLGLADSELGRPVAHLDCPEGESNGLKPYPEHHEPSTEQKVVSALQALIRDMLP